MTRDSGGLPAAIPESHQVRFHRRWPALRDPHVRALAWLLYAPDLMAADAPCWEGRIATLGPISPEVAGWLHDLQEDPALHAALLAHLAHNPSARLGRYAEKLLGFYLQQQGWLVAANLQVRNNQGETRETLGEFDFLVHPPDSADDTRLVHWEFATKFYLLEPRSADDANDADAFVGPNLADSLGRKMRKIMQQQLQLSRHAAASAVLPAPVAWAGALVKGWLFYREGVPMALPASMGIAADHCRGFWCDAQSLRAQHQPGDHYLILARLAWLAPARVPLAQGLVLDELLGRLEQGFQLDASPVMVARCRIEPGVEAELIETDRGFIVPPGWEQRAAATVRHAVIGV